MREGPHLTREQRLPLTTPVNEEEILNALKGIGDLKSPGIDGYGAKVFKASWNIIREDTIAAMHNFFNKEYMLKAFNNTVVTLILKSKEAKTIKECRPIAGCTTLYKVISNIVTTKLGRVLSSITSQCQATFIPGQKIHNHITLAFELLKGYTRKGGTPRCMMQLDLQKSL
ncbi:unnamed protein product [Lathyrus sativus]|nr:unnamed protein product [Lathyrus sativus]